MKKYITIIFHSFNMSQYKVIKDYAEGLGLDFLCTAFDPEAVDFLESLDIKIYKLASHSATNIELLEYMAQTGKQAILSTGMAELAEVDTAVKIFKEFNTPLLLLHCVSAYPTPLDECNLRMIDVLKDRFGLPVGYSGHERGIAVSIAAIALDACIVERHFTMDRSMEGPDHAASLEPTEFTRLV